MSLQEVYDILYCIKEKQKESLKAEALLKYTQALQIAECIAKTKDIKKEMVLKNIWDYYPSLFNEEKQNYQKEHEEESLLSYKQKRLDYARMHNTRFGGDTI